MLDGNEKGVLYCSHCRNYLDYRLGGAGVIYNFVLVFDG